MPKRIELEPLAEIGRAYAVIDDGRVEIHVSGVMGVLKAWLVGGENLPLGNIVGGRLVREADVSAHNGVLITQSGRQMFYGGWTEDAEAPEPIPKPEPKPEPAPEPEPAPAPEPAEMQKEADYAPLPNLGWEKITGLSYPTMDDRVRLALSTRAFFHAFKKHGFYLFGKDGGRFALAVKRAEQSSPFPNVTGAEEAGDYVYVVL